MNILDQLSIFICLIFSSFCDCVEMGCKLSKPRGSDEAPGKIFSTLRRAQVETQCGVAYTYHYLDFLLGKEGKRTSSRWAPSPSILPNVLAGFSSVLLLKKWNDPNSLCHFKMENNIQRRLVNLKFKAAFTFLCIHKFAHLQIIKCKASNWGEKKVWD